MRFAHWTVLTTVSVASVLVLTSVSSLGLRNDENHEDVEVSKDARQSSAISEPIANQVTTPAPAKDVELETVTEAENPRKRPALRVRVDPGDTISTLLGDLGIAPSEIHKLLQGGPEAARLYRIFPGQVLQVDLDEDGRLERLRFEESAARSFEWTRAPASGEFNVSVNEIEPEIKLGYASESIVKNLFIAGQRSGLGDEIILRLAKIFRWDIDFVLDIRASDTFEVLYESEYLDGEFYRYGEILAARFVNRGKVHTAVRYVDASGEPAYYAPDGTNLRGAFLRTPVDFTRVSSGFSHTRKHPLFDRVRAHLGVDYAAPTGTPVKAAGKGTVTTVASRASSGNYVEIRHAGGIETRYLHLSRFASGLDEGDRVSQGDIIGFVGATGWATGPHLHYEFIQNGRHQDPQRVEVIRDTSITERERIRFLVHMDPLLHRLDGFSSQQMSVIAAQ